MTGAEIFALVKDGGPWGLLAIIVWRWFKTMDAIREIEAARLTDTKELLKDAVKTAADQAHALERLEEAIRAKP